MTDKGLDVGLHRISIDQPIHLIIDSTGLSVVGEGEWAAAKYGGRGRRGWKKLHLGVDRSGVIVAETLTDGDFNDAKTGLALIDNVEGDIESLTADSACDSLAIYTAGAARGADVVVPPSKSATRSRQRRSRSSTRDRTILRNELWPIRPQFVEATIACNVLNRMAGLGVPASFAITG